MAGHIKDKKSN